MAKKLILITGMSGSGKTTLANQFRDQGIFVINMGDVIRDLARERKLAPTPENLGKLATEIRKKGGEDAVANLCIEKIEDFSEELVLVDGIRSINEVNAFKKKFEVVLIAVFSSQQDRYFRLKKRRRSDDPLGFSTFMARDIRELGFNLGHAIALADFVIVNDSSLEDFKDKSKELGYFLGVKE
jgi:dephospho-CoA kinase